MTDNAKLRRTGENEYSAQTDPAYWNLIGPFGGWIAAVLLRAVLEDPRRIGEPLSFSVDFAGPMEPGPFAVRIRESRHNRSTTFWSADLIQEQNGGAAPCAFAKIVTAKRRETPAFLEMAPPAVAPPEGLRSFAGPGVTLAFLARLDMRYAGTGMLPSPVDGATTVWARVRDAAALDYESLTAICDAGLPQIFARLKKRVPISSVTMNVFYHGTPEDLASVGEDFVLNVSRMRAAAHGYFDTATSVWTRSGRLLATTEQIVWFKARE